MTDDRLLADQIDPFGSNKVPSDRRSAEAIKWIDPFSLQLGKPLPYNLFDSKEHLFMRAGQVIELIDLTLSESRLAAGIFVDERKALALELLENGTVPAISLRPGMGVPLNLYDDQSVLLLPAGAVVTSRLIAQIRRRGVSKLHADPGQINKNVRPSKPGRIERPDHGEKDGPKEQTQKTRQLDRDLEANPYTSDILLPNRNGPIAPTKSLTLNNLREETVRGREQLEQTISDYANISLQVLKGKSVNVGVATEMLQGFVDLQEQDPSLLLLILKMSSGEDEYLFRHGLNVALISMTVAARMGYPQHQVLDTAVGSLFQDIGMLRVPQSIRFAPRKLTPEEWLEVKRHPILTVDTLERITSLSQTSFIVSYQSHERCDRSGYPRCRPRQYIHPMARVVAAADTYAAIICPRPHRRADIPFTGMATLLREAAEGRLDRSIVRTFLEAMSLFPVGSYVRLSDGTTAKVLRPNGNQYKNPIVVPLHEDGSESDVELNISAENDLTVVEVLHPSEVPDPTKANDLTRAA